jgi:hypothetical protein
MLRFSLIYHRRTTKTCSIFSAFHVGLPPKPTGNRSLPSGLPIETDWTGVSIWILNLFGFGRLPRLTDRFTETGGRRLGKVNPAASSTDPRILRDLWRTRRIGPHFVTHEQQSLRAAVASWLTSRRHDMGPFRNFEMTFWAVLLPVCV